jgi:dynein heavy chain
LSRKLTEDYPDTAAVAQELRKRIDEFSKNLPLIRCFTSEAIFDEEWSQIQKYIGNIERDEIKVSEIIEQKMDQYIEEIEEITMRAEKKFSLQQKLKQMKDEMKVF